MDWIVSEPASAQACSIKVASEATSLGVRWRRVRRYTCKHTVTVAAQTLFTNKTLWKVLVCWISSISQCPIS